ncbi:MAG: hypothetical protein R3Y12_08640 [Clostridia bacterium]
MTTSQSLPLTLFRVYTLFIAGMFATFLWVPYLIIRYIHLKNYLSLDPFKKKCKYISKAKIWGILIVASPLTASLTVFLCDYFGDGYFLSFFMFLGVLVACPCLACCFHPKVKKLEEQLNQTLPFK